MVDTAAHAQEVNRFRSKIFDFQPKTSYFRQSTATSLRRYAAQASKRASTAEKAAGTYGLIVPIPEKKKASAMQGEEAGAGAE
jgi:hypothetical protein